MANYKMKHKHVELNNTFGILFNNGRVSVRGDTWKRHTRFMLPMLKRSKVLPYLHAIAGCVDRYKDQSLVEYDDRIRTTDLESQCQNILPSTISLIS